MKRSDYRSYQLKAQQLYEQAHIVLSAKEKEQIEITDMGLDDFEKTGLAILIYINTPYYCAKEMALLPGQTCAEHIHAPIPEKNYPGKQETFRCRYGKVYLYVSGETSDSIKCAPPDQHYTVFHEIEMNPGEQYTIRPNTKHWFQAGPQGAVISEFSTTSYDEYDIFTNPDIKRIMTVEE